MGMPVMILGESGSGKTYSIKNFQKGEALVFSVEKNRLPFKSDLEVIKNANYPEIGTEFLKPKYKVYIIDDAQYLLVNEMFDRAKEAGFQKWTDMAKRFRDVIHYINHKLPDDVIVYFLHHTEFDSTSGKIKAKTVGKLLDNQLTVEGCFDIVLRTSIEGGEHYFLTQSDGYDTCKSPEGMFEYKIPNDLKKVDTVIREYYGIKEVKDGGKKSNDQAE
jgi:hypothetical protein